jgi:hypothetical protein
MGTRRNSGELVGTQEDRKRKRKRKRRGLGDFGFWISDFGL